MFPLLVSDENARARQYLPSGDLASSHFFRAVLSCRPRKGYVKNVTLHSPSNMNLSIKGEVFFYLRLTGIFQGRTFSLMRLLMAFRNSNF